MATALPKKLLIRATKPLPEPRMVDACLGSISDYEGNNWKDGFELWGVHARAIRPTDKVEKPGKHDVLLSIKSATPDTLDDMKLVIEQIMRAVGSRKLLTLDGAPFKLPA
jgi:hypothetical protein